MSVVHPNGTIFSASAVAALCVILSAIEVSAQRGLPGGANPARDAMRAINRQELDMLLMRKRIESVNDEPARRRMLKQINDDFREIQNLNNRMMTETWATPTTDYQFVSKMISRIRDKAKSLKVNLNLPEATVPATMRWPDLSNDKEFRQGLIVLDKTIMSFVQNPVFKLANAIDVTHATKARQDLDNVIEMTAHLRKAATQTDKKLKNSVSARKP